MPTIESIRPVLLSVPYGNPDSFINQHYLNTDHRTCGMIEITLDTGTTGVGEAYLAKFAPELFECYAEFMAPHLIGKEAADINQRYEELCALRGYWSSEGAGRQVISAFEIALIDAMATHLDVPAHTLLGGKRVDTLTPYGSGGEGTTKERMIDELERLDRLGVDTFKIRAHIDEVNKTIWVLNRAEDYDIEVGIDLMATPESVKDVLAFVEDVRSQTSNTIAFLEEPLARGDLTNYRLLRETLPIHVSGGEAIKSASVLVRRLEQTPYDIIQPDATVMGGMNQLLDSFAACRRRHVDLVVHCWGGPACMMANYHAAVAGGGRMVEWPMPAYPIREKMLVDPLEIDDGRIPAPDAPGLGIELTDAIEEKYPYRDDAQFRSSAYDRNDEYWTA